MGLFTYEWKKPILFDRKRNWGRARERNEKYDENNE